MSDLLRLRKLLRPYLPQVLLSLLVLLLVTASRLVVPAIIGNVIDYGLGGNQERGQLMPLLVLPPLPSCAQTRREVALPARQRPSRSQP